MSLAQTSAKVDFAREVQPIFRQYCYECHGPSQQMQGLRLDRRRAAMPNRVGANRAGIVPGNSGASPVYLKLTGKQAGLQMPPTGALSGEQITIIKTWIDQGAEWPDELEGEAPAAPADPLAARMMEALRNGQRPAFLKLLRENPGAGNRIGPGGFTPLMYAALYGDADSVRLLLERGADANARNGANTTALFYAIDDAEKTRLLLEHGVDPNARSDEGETPLLLAAARAGSSGVVKLLLDHGGNPSAQDSIGRTALSLAAFAGDADSVRALLDRGAAKKPLPLAQALRAGCTRCTDALLPFADQSDLSDALTGAVRPADGAGIRMLLDRGARSGANVLQALALSPEILPGDLMKTLVGRAADVNAKTRMGGTILDLARLQGDTPLVRLLVEAGAREGEASEPPLPKPSPAVSPRAAIERSLPLLQHADVEFLQRAGCISCHNNSLTAMSLDAARRHGVAVNEPVAQAQVKRMAAILEGNRERALQALALPGGLDTVSYILLGLAAARYPANEITDAWALYLKNAQSLDGRWRCLATRPPLESSDFETTAASLRALLVYAPESRQVEYQVAVQRGAQWLEGAQPKTTEDRAFQLLGLWWAGGNRQVMARTAKELLAEQRSDGGWAQLRTLGSDAYATGQALVALRESGSLSAGDGAYQRGVEFLRNSQLADGSWYVRTRTTPVQPYFDSDFPHGRSQFISAAATNWAVMALAAAVRGNSRSPISLSIR